MKTITTLSSALAGAGALIGSAATQQSSGQCARLGYDDNGAQVLRRL